MGFLEIIYLFGLSTLFFQVGNYWSVNLALLGFAFIIMLLEILIFSNNRKYKVFNGYVTFIFLWLIWSLLSYLWIEDIDLWLRNNQYLILAFGYTVLTSYLLKSKGKLKNINILISISTMVHVGISIFEYISGIYLFTSNSGIISIYKANRWPVSFFYNTNDLTTFLVFGFITLLYLDTSIFNYDKTKKFFKIIKVPTLLLITFIILVTESRLNFIAIAISMLIYLLMNIDRKYYLLVTLAMTALLGVGLVLINITYSSRIINLLNSDASGSTRLALINSGLILLKNTNYLGAGAGNFEYFATNFTTYGSGTITTMHNWWIENLTNYGLIFFTIYVFFYIISLRKAYIFSFRYKMKDAMYCFTWLLVFIISSNASSSNFHSIWIWVANAIVFCILHNTIIMKRNKEEESTI